MRTVNPAAAGGIFANTSTHQCLLEGNVWGAGNILLGGAGNDLIEGRGADDIIDGDRYVNVRLSVRTNAADPASQIGTTDLMTGVAKSGNFGTGTAGMTLQQAVFAGLVDPGNIVAVREILTSTTPDTDVALFSGPRTNYTVTAVGVGAAQVITVTDNVGTDGIDTVRNVETLRFTDGDVAASTIVAPAPVATFSPTTTLAFGLRDTGVQATQPVTVTNDGTANLAVSAVAITGAGFAVTNNGCTAAVAPAGTCTITVGFTPTTTTAVSGQLSVTHNAAGYPDRDQPHRTGSGASGAPDHHAAGHDRLRSPCHRFDPDAERQADQQRPGRTAAGGDQPGDDHGAVHRHPGHLPSGAGHARGWQVLQPVRELPAHVR